MPEHASRLPRRCTTSRTRIGSPTGAGTTSSRACPVRARSTTLRLRASGPRWRWSSLPTSAATRRRPRTRRSASAPSAAARTPPRRPCTSAPSASASPSSPPSPPADPAVDHAPPAADSPWDPAVWRPPRTRPCASGTACTRSEDRAPDGRRTKVITGRPGRRPAPALARSRRAPPAGPHARRVDRAAPRADHGLGVRARPAADPDRHLDRPDAAHPLSSPPPARRTRDGAPTRPLRVLAGTPGPSYTYEG